MNKSNLFYCILTVQYVKRHCGGGVLASLYVYNSMLVHDDNSVCIHESL